MVRIGKLAGMSQGDEPKGSTGEWGVWREAGDSDCGGVVPPQPGAFDIPDASLSGLNSTSIRSLTVQRH